MVRYRSNLAERPIADIVRGSQRPCSSALVECEERLSRCHLCAYCAMANLANTSRTILRLAIKYAPGQPPPGLPACARSQLPTRPAAYPPGYLPGGPATHGPLICTRDLIEAWGVGVTKTSDFGEAFSVGDDQISCVRRQQGDALRCPTTRSPEHTGSCQSTCGGPLG